MSLDDERSAARGRDLGMDRAITRRDFLNGVAIGIGSIAAGTWLSRVDAEAAQFAQDAAGYYPPALTGMRGSGKALIQTSGSSVVGAYDNGEASDDTFDEDTPFTPQPEKAMRVAIDQ